jgi:hypothetical protein
MFSRSNAPAILAGLFALAGCALPEQPSGSGSAVAPYVTPDKNCGGIHGVNVTPCPIRLTKRTKKGIVVTVSGPGVVNSSLGRINSCFSGYQCYYIERYGSSQVEWLITSGKACGGADVEFYGEDGGGNEVGYFFLKVANKYCP